MNDTTAITLTIPLIVGMVAAIRQMVPLPSRALPLLAVGTGVALSLLADPDPWRQAILTGVMMGLAASGLYAGGKTLVQG